MSAGCRIGRVRMKNGGADVRVLPSRQATGAALTLKAFVRDVLQDAPPDAVALVAWWRDPDGAECWRSVALKTDHPDFPYALLPDMARAELRRSMHRMDAEERIMRALGYVRDEPDPAS